MGYADRQAVTDDYQELLRRGFVVRRYRNILGWMSSLSAEARLDCLRVETSVSPLDGTLGWALLRRPMTDVRMAETARVMLIRELAIETADQDTELDARID